MSTQARAKLPTEQGAQASNVATQQMPSMASDTRSAPQVPPEMTRMPGTETKPSLKTTEFYIYLIGVVGILAASQLVGQNYSGVDVFRADRAWLYITLLTIGYIVSRGLAKTGSSWRKEGERGR